MNLNNLRKQEFANWCNFATETQQTVHRLVIVASGYEERSSYLCQQILSRIGRLQNTLWLVLGFCDSRNVEARPNNEAFYLQNGFQVVDFSSDEHIGVCQRVIEYIKILKNRTPKVAVEIHLDYSSMPRRWYCQIFETIIANTNSSDYIYLWYAGGAYDGAQFPTAGISDVSLFCGSPSLNPEYRTHIFGLGFDRIRASAIYRVIDPQSLVCFIGGFLPDYVSRVKRDNYDLLAAARQVFTAPVTDFPNALARITDVTREYAADGDVILVPDGPKPLVLASSLVPRLLNRTGIVSLHVRRRKSADAGRINVKPSTDIYGFSVMGEMDA